MACAAAAACRRAGAPPPPPPAQLPSSRDAYARPHPAPPPPGEIRVRIRVRVTPPPTPPPPGLREESLDGLSDGRTWQVVMAGRLADHSYPSPPVAYPPPPGAHNAAAPAHAHAHAPCAAATRAAATPCMPRRLCRKQSWLSLRPAGAPEASSSARAGLWHCPQPRSASADQQIWRRWHPGQVGVAVGIGRRRACPEGRTRRGGSIRWGACARAAPG